MTRTSTLAWTSLTTAGLAGGLVLGILVGMPLGRLLGAMIVTAVVTGLVGAVLGTMQSLYLRRLHVKAMWWIAATVLGTGVGLALGVVIIEQTGILLTGQRPNVARLSPSMRALSFVVLGLVAGAILGFAQWVVLRAKHWVLNSAIALAIAFAASSLLVDASLGGIASAAGAIVFVLASGVLFGALTSWPLRAH
jgi:hypothetical protein